MSIPDVQNGACPTAAQSGGVPAAEAGAYGNPKRCVSPLSFPLLSFGRSPLRPQRTGGLVERGWSREPPRCEVARGRSLGRPRPCVAWPREWSVAETWNEHRGAGGGNVLRKELDTVALRKFFHFLYSDLEIRGRAHLAIQSRLVSVPSVTEHIFRYI